MKASAWSNGQGTYGIRVGTPNRDRFFDPSWEEIEVEIDGRFHTFGLTSAFWRKCPEFRDRGEPVIREWLRRNRSLSWLSGDPPKVELESLGHGRFRLLA